MKKIILSILLGLFVIACGKDDSYDPVEVDNQAPSKPLNLVASEQTGTSIKLTWEASTDNIGVTGYRIYQDGIALPSLVSGTTTTLEALKPVNGYEFYITATDEENNESPSSNTVSTQTEYGDLLFGNGRLY